MSSFLVLSEGAGGTEVRLVLRWAMLQSVGQFTQREPHPPGIT